MSEFQDEIIDAESSTLNKEASPLEHLKHLLAIGWSSSTPMVIKFAEKYNLSDELIDLSQKYKS